MDSSLYEEIGGYRFCRPRHRMSKSGKRSFVEALAFLAVVTFALLFGSKWAVIETEKGNSLPSKLVIIGFLVLVGALYLSAFVGIFTDRRRKANLRVEPLPGIPAGAAACEVKLYRNGHFYIAAEGWLFVEQDLLSFRGDQFDFCLRYCDFHRDLDTKVLADGRQCRFIGPKKMGQFALALVKRAGGSEFKPLLEQWRRAATTARSSLYPPFQHKDHSAVGSHKGQIGKIIVGFGLAVLIFGGLGLLTHAMFKDYLPQPNPWKFAATFAMIPGTFAFVLPLMAMEARGARKLIEQLKASGRFEME